eukprot:Seg1854.4 transcript_id=Seg1854.4/GoldUCD/mRNA.D3Y31 product="hypothetical protein" protein_id=Seg1854.4/GoldUCD/D3Y31
MLHQCPLDMANKIGDYMEKHKIRFLKKHLPSKIEKLEDGTPGRYKVTYKSLETGEENSDEFNTVCKTKFLSIYMSIYERKSCPYKQRL